MGPAMALWSKWLGDRWSTHHFHRYDEKTGVSMGAISDLRVRRVEEIVTAAGQVFSYRSFPDKPHVLHMYEPELYTRALVDWASTLG